MDAAQDSTFLRNSSFPYLGSPPSTLYSLAVYRNLASDYLLVATEVLLDSLKLCIACFCAAESSTLPDETRYEAEILAAASIDSSELYLRVSVEFKKSARPPMVSERSKWVPYSL